MKITDKKVYELTLKELFRLPGNWQVLVLNGKTKRYTSGTAGNCTTLGAKDNSFFTLSLPSGFGGEK